MNIELKPDPTSKPQTCKNIDWYSEGETRVVRVGGSEVLIRFVGRKGRRGRILVEAPAGAVFQEASGSSNGPS